MLHVSCAIIEHDNKVLICQRSKRMKLPLKWEFPGCKIEDGESKENCLKREIHEELHQMLGVLFILHISDLNKLSLY
ncbi:NUDIX domain-containing protein [Sphingobacterium chuzhouense]|uniref:8-oxo-dGTP diphosphatase n=1 Tax=Sphingobacterium chuzhouense TaxID=1742264 RepID=A0ABR7XR46_9SPHI|nr:NUDIX domain-containing protein [Sphingobacterium chuzhouense]MBD1421636.1 NUDIX domain-containing protein [Sphingobacterium chuzhouense]